MTQIALILIGVAVLAIFIATILLESDAFVRYGPALSAAKDLATIFGLATFIAAAVGFVSREQERQKQHALERVKLTIDLMSRFYAPPELEEVRRALREQRALPDPQGFPGSLRWDEVWVMNFFETLAIMVDERVLDINLVNKMLGSPILEVMKNPRMKQLVADETSLAIHSYEGYMMLYRKIREIRTKRSKAAQ